MRIGLVSRRFHYLVKSPFAWMHAFARFFIGPESLKATADASPAGGEVIRSSQRAFTRLTSTTSWSGEYLRRVKLLRCLVRGKPALPFAAPVPGRPDKGMAVFTFSSRLGLQSNHLHADWGHALDKRKPLFIHGFSGTGNVTSSDRKGKFDSWGVTDRNMFRSFAAEHPGSAEYGGGQGYIIGAPNIMDVSQGYGMIHSECTPGGNVFFIAQDQKRGSNLATFLNFADEASGQPKINHAHQCATTVWVAKSPAVPRVSSGVIGMMTASSSGVVSTHSLGPSAKHDQRFERGELTVRWMLSPGVPIVSLAVDDHLTDQRLKQSRVWAVAANALGEVFFLDDMPVQAPLGRGSEGELDARRERRAWQTGSTCSWKMIPCTRRTERHEELHDRLAPSYHPNSFWADGKDVSVQDNLRNYQRWLSMTPSEMQASFTGWNMRRSLEVDFGGDDGNGAGEHIVIIHPGTSDTDPETETGEAAGITRYTRRVASVAHDEEPVLTPRDATTDPLSWSFATLKGPAPARPKHFEWRKSSLAFGRYKNISVTSTGIDESIYAVNTAFEDAALGPSPANDGVASRVPGQRARFIAAGTSLGSVFLWNLRGPASASADLSNELTPLRIIHTASPGVTAVAVSSLYVVHGGADGLIQAWEPLGSNLEPLRTLTSQKSLNNRRRLIQAARANPGVRIGNLQPGSFAATNIVLDPDPTVLRGIAAVSGWLRFWSYSSASPDSDLTKTQKRKLRRGTRGLANSAGENFTGTRRVGLKGFVDRELRMRDLERRDDVTSAREQRRVANRFGLDLLGEDASEEEMMAYAKLLSEEEDQKRVQRSLQKRLPADATPDEVEAHRLALSEEDQQRWQWATWEERREMPTSESRLLSQLSSPTLAAKDKARLEQEEMDDDLRRAMELSMLDSAPTPRASTPPTPIEEADPYLAEAIRQSLASTSSSPAAASSSRVSDTVNGGEDELTRAIRLSMQERSDVFASSPPSSHATGQVSGSLSPWTSPKLNGQRRESAPLSEDEFPALSSSPATSGPGNYGRAREKGKGRGGAWS